MFNKTAFTTHRPLNLEVNENHTTKYGNKSLTCLGTHTWNSLPNHIKKQTVWHEAQMQFMFFFGVKYMNVNFALTIRPRI